MRGKAIKKSREVIDGRYNPEEEVDYERKRVKVKENCRSEEGVYHN